ncbi:MAG TPA: aspartate aminotransferase family protein [Spirochaetia bacterium]
MKEKNPAVETNLPFPPQYGTELLVIRRGHGVWLEDVAGKRYMDFAGGIAVNALGYGRGDLAKTAMRQMRKLPHISNLFATEPGLALARAMLARGPFPFASVFFGNSGTEANEAALKYARMYATRTRGPGHDKLLCFTNAFHGRTMGALSVTPTPKYQDPYLPLIPDVVVAPYNDPTALRRTLSGEFAGVIVEVIQGEGGLSTMSTEFAAALNESCRASDVILIADEVQTGMGRTGTFYASEGVGLQPDMITLAKPLGGGLPLSAVLIPQKVNALIHAGDHGTTFGGGPVTTAVACRVWEALTKREMLEHTLANGAVLRAGLEGLKTRHPCIGELRGKGLLQGFEYNGGDVKDLLGRLQQKGLLALRAGANVVRIAPPLVITANEIRKGIEIIEEVLS